MNYQETCLYLFSQLPQFEKDGATGYKEGLHNSLALDAHLGHPHHHFRSIHVAGTNGKGSCSHTLAAILQTCGYKVGLYTSPHLVDFRERIRVNGQCISEDYVVGFVEQERQFFETLRPSFFELATAMAFKYFSDMNVDIAVIEVGLGGRLDCTNIILPVLSVITNISFDHTQFLGDTLAKIAAEKAGIIKRGVPVVIGENNDETRSVFEAKARELDAPIVFAEDTPEVKGIELQPEGGIIYHTATFGDLTGDLGGIYQQKNLNTVLFALHELARQGYLYEGISEMSKAKNLYELQEGIAHVKENTGLMGRWQIIHKHPRVVCDTAHNVGGWQYLSRQLAMIDCQQMHIVFGMVDDKDVEGVMELLPKQAIYYFTKADSHRALSEDVVKVLAAKHGLNGESYPSVHEAYSAAMKVASRDSFVFVGGSSYVVGDFLKNCL